MATGLSAALSCRTANLVYFPAAPADGYAERAVRLRISSMEKAIRLLQASAFSAAAATLSRQWNGLILLKGAQHGCIETMNLMSRG